MSSIHRIGLVGSAGLGKSTVASMLSKKFSIPFIKSKDITRPILSEFGYDYASGQFVERFLSRPEIERRIVDERIRIEGSQSGGFVTDRTTVECLAYALLDVEQYDDEQLDAIKEDCFSHLKSYDSLFLFVNDGGWLEDNGLRTINRFFQWKTEMIICGLMDYAKAHYGIGFRTIPEEYWGDAEQTAEYIRRAIDADRHSA